MPKALIVFAVLFAIEGLVVNGSTQPVSTRIMGSYGTIDELAQTALHVDGQWIVDANGNRIQLRGAGCDYYAYGRLSWLSTYISWMKQTGCTCLRLSFNVPNPGNKWNSGHSTEYDPAKMDYVLELLAQNGLYAVLDCHHYWATPDPQGWTDVLPTYEQDWIDCWVSIANRYKNNSVIAAYELDNEPYGSSGDELKNTYYACIDAIRATGDNHIVMCSIPERESVYDAEKPGSTWSSASQVLPNMCLDIHEWHTYNPDQWFNDSENGISISPEIVASEYIATALDYRARLNCPVFLGEFGVYNYSMASADIRSDQLTIQMAEQYGIPWLTWMMDAWIQYAPTFWPTFVNTELRGPFTSNRVLSSVALNQTFSLQIFPALPFNIWTHVNETLSHRYMEYGYNRWGVCYVTVPQDYPVVFYGPCTLRIQGWGGTQPYWGSITDNYIVTLAQGQTWDASSNVLSNGYTVVYAWES